MPKIPRLLKVEQILFSSGERRTRELPKTVYRGLILECNITHTNGASPSITVDTFLQILSSINLVINGQDQLISLNGRDIYYMNRHDFSVDPYAALFTTASSSGTSTVRLYVPLALTRALQPEDTLLDARKVSSVVLEIDWGTTIGSGVNSLDSGNLKIEVDEYTNAAADLAVGRHEMGALSRNLDATGELTLDLEVGSNNQYRRLFLFARDNAGALSNSQIDNIKVSSRSFVYADVSTNLLAGLNTFQFARAQQTGVWVIDFTRDGKMTQRIDARNLSELIVTVNSLVSNGSLRVVKDKVIFA